MKRRYQGNMDEVKTAVLEILENGMKEEYKLEEIASMFAEYFDTLIEDIGMLTEKIIELQYEVK